MSKKVIIGALIVVLCVIFAIIMYCRIAAVGHEGWFAPLMMVCAVTFFLGSGLLVSGLILEKSDSGI